MQLSAHQQRLATGLALAALLFSAVFMGGWYVKSLVLLATLLGLWEFYAFFWPGLSRLPLKITGLVLGGGFLASFPGYFLPLLFLGLAFLCCAFFFLCAFGMGEEKPDVKFTDYTPLPFGLLYVALPLALALLLTPAEQLLVVFVAIGTDAGGYYAGNAFGKHKIWPRVSPKKTWEGALGGVLACIVVCLVASWLGTQYGLAFPAYPLWVWVSAAVFLNAASQLGDFFESALKRTVNVKDSGTLLPGHGGILDRIDSLLFVLPAYCLVKALFVPFTALAALLAGQP